jgi:hypothetical protein
LTPPPSGKDVRRGGFPAETPSGTPTPGPSARRGAAARRAEPPLAVRPRSASAPSDAVSSGRGGRPWCASAPGSRGSSSACGCSAGRSVSWLSSRAAGSRPPMGLAFPGQRCKSTSFWPFLSIERPLRPPRNRFTPRVPCGNLSRFAETTRRPFLALGTAAFPQVLKSLCKKGFVGRLSVWRPATYF